MTISLHEKTSTIQYDYKKCGTHARVFYLALVHQNRNNENKTKKLKKKVRREVCVRKKVKRARKKRSTDSLTIAQVWHMPHGIILLATPKNGNNY